MAGLTLVEILIAAAVIAVALLVASSSSVRAELSRKEARERSQATAALGAADATLQSLGLTAAFQGYAPSPGGQPFPAAGSGPGAPFLATGLADAADPSQQAQVTVRFFTDETEVVPEFGMPRDLDADGAATNDDTSVLGAGGELLATILPYTLTLTWRGGDGGTQTTTWHGVLTANQ